MPDGIEQEVEKTEEQTDANEGKSMLDFVKTQIGETGLDKSKAESDAQKVGDTEKEKAAVEDSESEVEEKEEPKEGEEEKEEQEEKKEVEEKGDEDAEPEDKVEEKKDPVPYERFEEVNTKYRSTVEEYEKVKPMVEAHQQIISYCNEYNITQEQFSKLLNIQRLLNTDPEAALKEILPVVEAVQGFTGDRLPADLQTKVDTGKMDLADAREMAKLRAHNQLGGTRFQQFQKVQQERQQQQFQTAQVNAITAWTSAKTKNDPDFKPRAKKEDPKGRFEFVYDAVQSMLAERNEKGELIHTIKSPDDVPKLLEAAYQEVVRSLAPLSRKPATRKGLTHTGSTARNNEIDISKAKTMGEAIRLAAAGHLQ